MTDQPRIIATIDAAAGYDGLIAMFRARIVELGAGYASLEHVTKLPDGYITKMMAAPSRRMSKKGVIGRVTLGPLLQALGIKLVVMADENPMMARLEKRSVKGMKIDDAKVDAKVVKREKCRISRTKFLLMSCAGQRSNIARIAANARWAVYRKQQARLAVRRAARRAAQ